ncbi:MAG: type II secretion system F family protein [Nanobdellota archaeon]
MIAHMNISTHKFIKNSLINSFFASIFVALLLFFVLKRFLISKGMTFSDPLVFLFTLVFIFPLLLIFFTFLILQSPNSQIKKRRKDIEKNVLFAGRYLLIKLNSGQPLYNALIEASKDYGVASKYFKEIVDNINLGVPIEEALERAIKYSPSPAFQQILFNVINALKIGIDISETLKEVLDDIAAEQLSEIEAYTQKLNSITLFYMLLGVVVPSLGLTIFVVIAGMVGFSIGPPIYIALFVLVLVLQLFFVNFFHKARPNINF